MVDGTRDSMDCHDLGRLMEPADSEGNVTQLDNAIGFGSIKSRTPIVSRILWGLNAKEISVFGRASCCIANSTTHVILYDWSSLLALRGLRAGRGAFTISQCQIVSAESLISLDPDTDMDEDVDADKDDLPRSLFKDFERWANCDAKRTDCLTPTWGMEIGREGMNKLLQLPRAKISLRELHSADVAISAGMRACSDWDSLSVLGFLVIVMHARDQTIQEEALSQLGALVQAFVSDKGYKSEDEEGSNALNFHLCITVFCCRLLYAKDLEEACKYLELLMDALLRSHGPGCGWVHATSLPFELRRASAFVMAAAMAGHQSLSLDSGGQQEELSTDQQTETQKCSVEEKKMRTRLLASGSELLAALLPSNWTRGTSHSEDPLLRSAASLALNSAETALGGWAGEASVVDGAPAWLALRSASRRLRAKLGLRMGG